MKDSQESHKASYAAVGKVVCVMQERYESLRGITNPDGTPKKSQLSGSVTFPDFWGTVTEAKTGKHKGKGKLNPHWYSCAVAFGMFVRSELITEKDYDDNSNSNIELAGAIAKAIGGDLEHEAATDTAYELSHQTKNTPRKLAEILESVSTAKPLTEEQARKSLAKLFAAGFLQLVIGGIGAEIAHCTDDEEARSAFFGMLTANGMFAVNTVEVAGADGKKVATRRFPDAKLQAWENAYLAKNAPVAPAPVAEVKPAPVKPATPAPAKPAVVKPATAPVAQAA